MKIDHGRNNGHSGLFFLLMFLILAGVGTFIFLSLRVDTVEESLKNNSVIKTLFVLEER